MTYTRTRLLTAATLGAVAVVLRLAYVFVEPAGSEGSTRQEMAAMAAHPAASYVAIWLDMLAFALAALACITVTGLVTGRGRALTQVGGWLTTISFLALGFGSFAFGPVAVAGVAQDDRTVRTIEAMGSNPGVLPLFLLLFLGLVTPIVLAVGLVRAGLVGWWFVALNVLDAVLFVVLGGEHTLLLNVIGLVPFAGVLLTWSWMLRRAAHAATAPVARVEPALA